MKLKFRDFVEFLAATAAKVPVFGIKVPGIKVSRSPSSLLWDSFMPALTDASSGGTNCCAKHKMAKEVAISTIVLAQLLTGQGGMCAPSDA